MVAPTSYPLPELGRKLQILYAYTGLRGVTLAKAINRSEATLSEWVKGTDLRAPGHVPQEGRELLAKLLVDLVGGTIGIDRARRLWAGSLRDFAAVFAASTEETFLGLLTSVERTDLLRFLPEGLGDLQLVDFGRGKSGGGPQVAFVGDAFALQASGRPGDRVVLIVETAVGRHLGMPGGGAEGRIGPRGILRLPEAGCWVFNPPPGLHRFVLFVLERDAELSIARLMDLVRPLGPEDIELLIGDLSDRQSTRGWRWDQLLVDVRARPTAAGPPQDPIPPELS